jgi:hypothetical protein
MRKKRTPKPAVETLESKAVLSAMGGSPAVHVAAMVSMPSHHSLVLHGTLTGTITSKMTLPDVGGHFDVKGSGQLKPLGKVQATSDLVTPGFIWQGHATGTLTLSGHQGSVTLQLTGPAQPGFSPPPTSFTFTIVSGTGRFRHATGTGAVDVQYSPVTGGDGMVSNFTAQFHANAKPA